MHCDKLVIAPIFGYTFHDLRCMNCGREVTIKYRKDMWPLNWWYSHLGKRNDS